MRDQAPPRQPSTGVLGGRISGSQPRMSWFHYDDHLLRSSPLPSGLRSPRTPDSPVLLGRGSPRQHRIRRLRASD